MKINPYLNETQLALRESIVSLDKLAVGNADYRIVLRKVCMDMRVMVRRPVLAIHAHFQSGKFRQSRHRHLPSAERGKETAFGWRNANRSSFADSISSLSSSTSLSTRGFPPSGRYFTLFHASLSSGTHLLAFAAAGAMHPGGGFSAHYSNENESTSKSSEFLDFLSKNPLPWKSRTMAVRPSGNGRVRAILTSVAVLPSPAGTAPIP